MHCCLTTAATATNTATTSATATRDSDWNWDYNVTTTFGGLQSSFFGLTMLFAKGRRTGLPSFRHFAGWFLAQSVKTPASPGAAAF